MLVTVNSDDPGMMGTTICDDYEAVADRFDYELTTVEDIALDAIDASWAPADEQAALREPVPRRDGRAAGRQRAGAPRIAPRGCGHETRQARLP